MEITRLDNQTLRISQLDSLLRELLERIVSSADPAGSEAAEERLFSKPTDDAEEAGFVEDWREYVEPGLRQHFQSSLEVIVGDLNCMQPGEAEGESVLTIRLDHLENWIHGLNQARLVLVARHSIKEDDMHRILPLSGDPHALALLQIRFYDILLEFFLQEVEGE